MYDTFPRPDELAKRSKGAGHSTGHGPGLVQAGTLDSWKRSAPFLRDRVEDFRELHENRISSRMSMTDEEALHRLIRRKPTGSSGEVPLMLLLGGSAVFGSGSCSSPTR